MKRENRGRKFWVAVGVVGGFAAPTSGKPNRERPRTQNPRFDPRGPFFLGCFHRPVLLAGFDRSIFKMTSTANTTPPVQRQELTRSAYATGDVEASIAAHAATKGAVEKHKKYTSQLSTS
jgi:hypothetical protein